MRLKDVLQLIFALLGSFTCLYLGSVITYTLTEYPVTNLAAWPAILIVLIGLFGAAIVLGREAGTVLRAYLKSHG